MIFTQIPIFTALFQSEWKIKDMKKSSSSLRRMGQRFISNKKSKFALNAKHFCVTKHIIKLTAVVACTVLSDKSVRNPNHDLIFYFILLFIFLWYYKFYGKINIPCIFIEQRWAFDWCKHKYIPTAW